MLRFPTLVICVYFCAPSNAEVQQPSSDQAWFQARDGEFRTYEFRDGHRTRRTGLFIRMGEVEVELQIEAVSADAWDCRWDQEPQEVRVSRRVHGLRLVALRGGTREVLLDQEIEMNTWVSDEIIIHGSLGPFVSVERRATYEAVCSAHGFPVRTFHWFDLRDGHQLDRSELGDVGVVLRSALEAPLTAAERELWQQYRDAVSESGLSTEGLQAYGGSGIEGITPRFEGARWRGRVHVALGVPQRWARGFTHNQIETAFEVASLPHWIPEPLTRVPPHVARFAERHPGIRFGGSADE